MAERKDAEILAETENFLLWRSQEDDIGYMYHLELGGITLHLMPEEWDEFVVLVRNVP
ncbi:MAG: hypothetical protein ACWGPS_10860 [Candidatus Promineifilaceae bacterium]